MTGNAHRIGHHEHYKFATGKMPVWDAICSSEMVWAEVFTSVLAGNCVLADAYGATKSDLIGLVPFSVSGNGSL
jgi:hypothetical protein